MFFSFLCLETVECAGVRKPVLLFRQPVRTAEPPSRSVVADVSGGGW